MNEKTKNVFIIILSVLLIISITIIVYLFIAKNDQLKELSGTVIVSDSKYLLVESEGEDYLINGIEEKYEVGDEVKFSYKEKNLDSNSNPKSIKIESEKIIKKYEKPVDKTDEEETPKPSSQTTPETPSNNPTTQKPATSNQNADEEVMNYFTGLETEFKSGSIKDSLKNGFITVVDFLFYDGKIKGHTFKELSDSAKLKVLSMGLYFDTKIEEYFPGYKESISGTTGKIYNSAKTEIVEAYMNVASLICNEDEELCTSAKEGFETLKKNFGLTWSLIKDIAGDGISSLKNWYEIWSGK